MKRPPINTWPTSSVCSHDQKQMNALLFDRPVWFATGPLNLEEEAQEMEDFTYHRPVLARKRSNCWRRARARWWLTALAEAADTPS